MKSRIVAAVDGKEFSIPSALGELGVEWGFVRSRIIAALCSFLLISEFFFLISMVNSADREKR